MNGHLSPAMEVSNGVLFIAKNRPANLLCFGLIIHQKSTYYTPQEPQKQEKAIGSIRDLISQLYAAQFAKPCSSRGQI